MAPAQIRRVVSAQGDIDSQFMAIRSSVHAIRGRRTAQILPLDKSYTPPSPPPPKISESIVSVHRDAPRYVLAKPDKGRRIVPTPFKNHADLELTLIGSLVGHNPPFSLFDESYGSPRRY